MADENIMEQDLLSRANAALSELDGPSAEGLYTELIQALQQIHNNNQKEMAAELKRLAGLIEGQGRADEAFRFKQRTCEVMLKLSMMERQRDRGLPRMASQTAQTQGKEHGPQSPFRKLEYFYIGTADFERDLRYYTEVLQAERVWEFHKFGARVAGLRLAPGPLILLADHKKAPGCEPIFSVDSLERTARELKARGWNPEEGPVETPNGPAYVFCDPSGNRYAILQNDRPEAMESAYRDPDSQSAVRR